jgi:hypothetical protein
MMFINCTVEVICLLRSDWSIFLPRDFAAREITGGVPDDIENKSRTNTLRVGNRYFLYSKIDLS